MYNCYLYQQTSSTPPRTSYASNDVRTPSSPQLSSEQRKRVTSQPLVDTAVAMDTDALPSATAATEIQTCDETCAKRKRRRNAKGRRSRSGSNDMDIDVVKRLPLTTASDQSGQQTHQQQKQRQQHQRLGDSNGHRAATTTSSPQPVRCTPCACMRPVWLTGVSSEMASASDDVAGGKAGVQPHVAVPARVAGGRAGVQPSFAVPVATAERCLEESHE